MGEQDVTNTSDTTKPDVIVSSDKHRQPLKLSNKKPVLAVVASLLVLILIAVFVRYITTPALSIGGYSYSRSKYIMLINEARKLNIGKEAAREAVVEALSARAAADKLSLSYPTDIATLNAAAVVKYHLDDTNVKPNDYQRVTAYPLVIEPVVRVTEKGGFKAAMVAFPFSRYILGFFEGNENGGSDSKLIGNLDAINDDVEYAKKALDAARNEYTNKPKTLDKIVARTKADKRLWYGQAFNDSNIILVSKDRHIESIYGSKPILDEVYASFDTAQPGKLSDTRETVFRNNYGVTVPSLARENNGVQVAWYFTVVDKNITQQKGILSNYNKLVKEYSRD